MPNQSHSGFSGVPWHRCDRCGREFHVSELTRQDGLIICKMTCFDNPITTRSYDGRQLTIQERLSDGQPEPDLAEILKSSGDDGGS